MNAMSLFSSLVIIALIVSAWHIVGKFAKTDQGRLAYPLPTIAKGLLVLCALALAVNGLTYYNVVKVPDALRGPVVGNELPAEPKQFEKVVAPVPAPLGAPVQPKADTAAEEHRRQLEEMKKR